MNIWNINIRDCWSMLKDKEIKLSYFNPFHFFILDIWDERRSYMYNLLEWWLDMDKSLDDILDRLKNEWIDIYSLDNAICYYYTIDISNPQLAYRFITSYL